MAILYLIRHGKAKSAWGSSLNPGLDELGHNQAKKVAQIIAPLGPLEIITSPLKRARETAVPLAQKWNITPRIEESVGEIPSPCNNLSDRRRWLDGILSQKWSDLEEVLQIWRRKLIDTLWSMDNHTAVFTHFIAINTAVGAATGDHRLVSFLPDNGSVTKVSTSKSEIKLLSRGDMANTLIY